MQGSQGEEGICHLDDGVAVSICPEESIADHHDMKSIGLA
jgi:hypothetical protein